MEREWVYENEDVLGSLGTVLIQLWKILGREWVYKNEDVLGSLCTVLFSALEHLRERMGI